MERKTEKGEHKRSRINTWASVAGIKRTIAQHCTHVLCLGNKFVKFAYEALEDEPRSSALGYFSIEQSYTSYKSVRVWYELGKLE
jgi:hypothetical protein